jgi:ASC-1-like (ASCH) protein
MSKSIEFHIDDPWFDYIASGNKTVEGKIRKGKALLMTVGSRLRIRSNDGKIMYCDVVDLRPYDSFEQYLKEEGLANTLPGVKTVGEGLAVYAKYFEQDIDRKLGVLAVELRFISFSEAS